jgi:hypothetical protein
MERPGIRDVNGEDVAFDVLDIDLTLEGSRFRKVYVRDCSDQGKHPVPLSGASVIVARDCFSGDRRYRSSFQEGAVWNDPHERLWVELRIEKDRQGKPMLLAFVWDRNSVPKVGMSKTTYITETYWLEWQAMKEKFKI